MRIIFGGTDTGLVRRSNQDCFVCGRVSDNMVYAVLCDGMGGENGGEVASETALGHISAALARDLREGMGELSIRSSLESAAAGANALVYEAASKDESLSGMGTTMIIAVVAGDTVYTLCVGDSRVYLVSEGKLRRLTHDHTVVQMLVDIGEISEEDARRHPKRHFITRAVGISPEVEADFLVEQIGEGESVLLCSDGLYTYLDESAEAFALIGECLNTKSAAPLIGFANSRGGTDNITAVIIA